MFSFLRQQEDIAFPSASLQMKYFKIFTWSQFSVAILFQYIFLLVQEYLHPILWHKLWCTYMNCNYQLNDKNRPIFMPSKCSQSLNYIKHILLHSQLEIREFWYTLLFSASKETTNYQFSLTTQLSQNTQSNIAERVP